MDPIKSTIHLILVELFEYIVLLQYLSTVALHHPYSCDLDTSICHNSDSFAVELWINTNCFCSIGCLSIT